MVLGRFPFFRDGPMNKRATWFRFYPADWLLDPHVTQMTLAQQGAYMRLLAYAWWNGGIPSDPRDVERLVAASLDGSMEPDFEYVWQPPLTECWEPHPTDPTLLVNPQQEADRSNGKPRK